ncbi:MAG: ABC transporter substrate-binding protein [Rhodobacteraceae bacterium]|jgi:branched-chain amino acid transport system substrate-binding protein|nr:ABC transporter substrate-binding protein [Paracoccaceae bacterium]
MAQAETDYTFSVSVDFTGPFADIMPNWHAAHRAMVDYWNDTTGKDLGVKVNMAVNDMRYDASVVAKTWPGILASAKPIMHIGMGSPDLMSLMKRLPRDQVPMIMGTAMVGTVWAPDGWHFSFRPTYSHEFAAMLDHLQKGLGEDRPLRIGTVSTQGRAGYEDQVKGVVQLTKMYPDRFEIAGHEWVADHPVTVTNEIRRMLESKPDAIIIGATTTQVIATVRALEELKASDVAVVTASQNGLDIVSESLGLDALEGDYSVFSFAPSMEPGLKARDVYNKYHTGAGKWDLGAAQSAAQMLVALRTLEGAVAAVGADKVTGKAMYESLLATNFTSEMMLGLTPDLDFDTTAPFPVGEIRAKAITVKDGVIVPASDGWMTAPLLEKW